MTLAHLLQRQARAAPDRPAILEGTRAWATHAQWAARSAGLAQRLRDAGLLPGDRVVLFMRNHPRYLEILWGAWWAGLVVVPINARLHPREIAYIVRNSGARALVYGPEYHEGIASRADEFDGAELKICRAKLPERVSTSNRPSSSRRRNSSPAAIPWANPGE